VFVFYLLVQFLHVHPSQFLVLNIGDRTFARTSCSIALHVAR